MCLSLCLRMIYVYSVWFTCTVLYKDHELLWSIRRFTFYYEQLTCVLHGLENYHYTPKLWIVYCLCWIIYKYISLTVFSEIKSYDYEIKLFCFVLVWFGVIPLAILCLYFLEISSFAKLLDLFEISGSWLINSVYTNHNTCNGSK